MDINLSIADGECWTLRINGKLEFHGVGGGGESRDQLEERLRDWNGELRRLTICKAIVKRARTVINLEDHVNTSPEKKRAAFCQGLLAAMLVTTAEEAANPPDHTRSFTEGFDAGLALHQCGVWDQTHA